MKKSLILISTLLFFPLIQPSLASDTSLTLLNVSYDPTRELYKAYNNDFKQYWKQKTGQDITIQQSNGGSGKQSLSVQNGLKADVVTLALAADIDALNNTVHLIRKDWQEALPEHSTPYTSTIVFLVRKGNPKNIKDWGDLIRDNISVITPNPKTSGGARWNFLAAWAWAKHQANGSDSTAQDFVQKLYQHVPIMDTGARGATITFTKRQQGDVLLAWENEAYLALQEAPDQFDIITPTLSILCEPPVAIVDDVVDKKGTRAVATEYLKRLYTTEAQRLIAKNFYRPIDPKVQTEFAQQFPSLHLVNIRDEFGGWQYAQKRFFADGGVFDKIYIQQKK
ncbi:sulfate ABC transporter substrate-binding protein [Pelistega europaea]|uniref:Sulfate-binding protein n=1 Tax=Pelistega europaea TaxID=106147 RepID=A0A7Y4P5R7_9BURK|nr:sulfate ABC transporter substrate-binding protein [Pelistega europaea]NOL49139.1 sulfate ABC transporter substrate-binding protein [Pelistega europaea]